MYKYLWSDFLNSEEGAADEELVQKIYAKLALLDVEYLTEEDLKNPTSFEFTHFFKVDDCGDFFLAAECRYFPANSPFGGFCLAREIHKLWTFVNEEDFEFYKVVLEMENPEYMNPCLCN